MYDKGVVFNAVKRIAQDPPPFQVDVPAMLETFELYESALQAIAGNDADAWLESRGGKFVQEIGDGDNAINMQRVARKALGKEFFWDGS